MYKGKKGIPTTTNNGKYIEYITKVVNTKDFWFYQNDLTMCVVGKACNWIHNWPPHPNNLVRDKWHELTKSGILALEEASF